MEDYFLRVWNDLGARVSGPLSLRLFLQPTMATIFAIRDGLKDAKTGRPPYFYSVYYDGENRIALLKRGLHAVAKIFILAMILDAIFQLIVFKWIYPVEVVLVALLLAFLPYLLLRGVVNRIGRLFVRKTVPKHSLILIGLLCCATVATAQDPAPSVSPEEDHGSVQAATDKWEFAVTPYVFLPRLTGSVGVLNQTAQVNASFSDIFRNLDFAAMGTFEARKRNWSVLVDGMYMSLSGQKVTPSPFFSDIDVKVREVVITPQVGYRVVQLERGSIDVLGGVRIWHVKSHLTFQPRILPLVDVEGSRNWADPIVGARGTVTVSPRTFLRGEFDAGGFGVGSNFTGQVFGGAGFQFKPRVALIGGYRYLRTDYVNDNFIFRTALSGVTIGAQFKL